MKIKWKMEQEDSVCVDVTYTEVGKIQHDLGTSILCEADIDNPNIIKIKNDCGEWEPECYTYKDNILEVYAWKEVSN